MNTLSEYEVKVVDDVSIEEIDDLDIKMNGFGFKRVDMKINPQSWFSVRLTYEKKVG